MSRIMQGHLCSGVMRQAGFITAKPWLKVNENYKAINVAAQGADLHLF